jgi:hypothetical protein
MGTQRCGSCGEWKPLSEFNLRSKITRKLHTTCKDCQRRFKRDFYIRDREVYLKKSALQKTEAIQRNRKLISEYLARHPCVDCHEADPAVLEFDHVEAKDRGIAQMVIDGVSWAKILQEIEKCEVRCVNCHRKKTAKQFGWYKKLGL